MSLFYEEEGENTLPLACEELAKEVVDAALDYIGCPYEAQVNLLLTTDEQIKEMNRDFRGIDRPTDVLSFPMVEYEIPGEFDFLEEMCIRDSVRPISQTETEKKMMRNMHGIWRS